MHDSCALLAGLHTVGDWSLAGTTVAPGYRQDDFELGARAELESGGLGVQISGIERARLSTALPRAASISATAAAATEVPRYRRSRPSRAPVPQ